MSILLHSIVITDDDKYVSGYRLEEAVRGVNGDEIMSEAILNEAFRRIEYNVSWGKRVIVRLGDIPEKSYRRLRDLAIQKHVPIVSTVDIDVVTNLSIPVVDSKWVEPPSLQNGAIVVGDIHGDMKALAVMISEAEINGLPLVFLGDVINYGDDTLTVADTIYDLVVNGYALMLRGNHERKILRWIDGASAKLSAGNRVTTRLLKSLESNERELWETRFRALYGMSQNIISFSNVSMAHAAIHPTYWDGIQNSRVIDAAMFGIMDRRTTETKYVPSFDWVDRIPKGELVLVGHHRRFSDPTKVVGSNGGHAVFLDTGGSKGGRHSAAIILPDGKRMIVERFITV